MSSDPAAFVAGVPVKISERYRPPRKVTLPAACHHQVNPEIFTQEYDFAIEKTTLQWVQDRRKRLEEEEKERNRRIAEYDKKKAERIAKEEEERQQWEEEEKERLKLVREEQERQKQEEGKEEEEEKKMTEKEGKDDENEEREVTAEMEGGEGLEDPPHEAVSSDEGGSEPAAVQGGTDKEFKQPQVDPQDSSPASSPVMTSVMSNSYGAEASSYEWMLQPTPFPSQKSTVRSPIKTPTNINFADFEGEGNDPFDSAALKSINDMEELAKVLDSSNIGQQTVSRNSSVPSKNANNPFLNGQGGYNAYGQYSYYVQQQQQHLHQQNMPQPGQAFPQYGTPVGTVSQVTSTSSATTVPSYTSNSQYGRDLSRNFRNPYYPQQWNNGYNVNSPSKTAQFVPYDYCLQAANLSNNANVSQGVVSPVNNQGNTSSVQSFTKSGSGDSGKTLGKRQDLEDFYSKYYSQNKTGSQQNQSCGGQSGESTPSHSSSSGAAGSTSGSLRSCRSVPDLTAPEDSEVTKLSSGIQSDGRGFSHTPPPRPSSTGLTGLEDWKPLPDIPGLTETLPHHLQPPLYTPVKSRLPDPFTELTTDAQALVQNMAEMGFPRPRVARAVQKLGTDHKKLIEVLLVLQSLQENGEDGYKAERAFYHYLGDVQKTRDHIAAAKQLLDLGFEEERIVDALLKHDNDRDKALEELIA